MSDQKPDAAQYARIVLWHLAGLRADVAGMHFQMLELLAKCGELPDKATQQKWEIRNHALRDKLYREALEEAKLGDPPTTPPASQDAEGGSRF